MFLPKTVKIFHVTNITSVWLLMIYSAQYCLFVWHHHFPKLKITNSSEVLFAEFIKCKILWEIDILQHLNSTGYFVFEFQSSFCIACDIKMVTTEGPCVGQNMSYQLSFQGNWTVLSQDEVLISIYWSSREIDDSITLQLPCLCPSEWGPAWHRAIQSSINLGETLLWIMLNRKPAPIYP